MSIEVFFTLLMVFLGGHAVADFAWQSAFMADAKRSDLIILFWHSILHALIVYFACVWAGISNTDCLILGYVELVAHFGTDSLKTWLENRLGQAKWQLWLDQGLHVLAKLVYIAWLGWAGIEAWFGAIELAIPLWVYQGPVMASVAVAGLPMLLGLGVVVKRRLV